MDLIPQILKDLRNQFHKYLKIPRNKKNNLLCSTNNVHLQNIYLQFYSFAFSIVSVVLVESILLT